MFEKLLTLVGDNEEAKNLIKSYETEISNKTNEMQAKIESLTAQFNDAKESRDAYKKGNQLVKQALGIDQINEETVKGRIEALSKDDAATELAKKLAEKDQEIEAIKSQAENQTSQMRIEFETEKALNDISDVLVDDGMLRDAFKGYLSQNIGSVDGYVSPVQKIGDKIIPVMKGDKPLSVSEYAKSMLESDQYKSFRKTSIRNSAGNTGGGGEPQKKSFVGKPEERRAAIEAMINKG